MWIGINPSCNVFVMLNQMSLMCRARSGYAKYYECVCVCLKLRHIPLDSGDKKIMCQDSSLHACPSGPISSCSQLFLSASYFLIGTWRSSAGSDGAQHLSLCCFDACWVLVHPLHPLQNMHDSQVAGALKTAWDAIMESSLVAV